MINISSLLLRLKKSYERNLPEFTALRKRLYPAFVFDDHMTGLRGEIPVFTFHDVDLFRFEEQLKFLALNKYQTITADDFYQFLTKETVIPKKTILLTFDDGLGSLWSIAYPLLKKYGFVATTFIVPGCVEDSPDYFPNLDDYWQKKASLQDVLSRESTSVPFCTWQEIGTMHQSGVIDFQSHTLYHNLEFTSSTIVDYIHPNFSTWHHNFRVPMLSVNGRDNVERTAELGTPIYAFEPRMAGNKRYFDDETLRRTCLDYVRRNNAETFFKNNRWRIELSNFVQNYIAQNGLNDHYETDQELRDKVHNDLYTSRYLIEKRLSGKIVTHLCYPWFVGSDLSVELSKNTGYKTNFWGTLPDKRTNRLGEDPYRVVRLREEYIHRLPGEGKKPLTNVLSEIFHRFHRGFLRKMFRYDWK